MAEKTSKEENLIEYGNSYSHLDHFKLPEMIGRFSYNPDVEYSINDPQRASKLLDNAIKALYGDKIPPIARKLESIPREINLTEMDQEINNDDEDESDPVENEDMYDLEEDLVVEDRPISREESIKEKATKKVFKAKATTKNPPPRYIPPRIMDDYLPSSKDSEGYPYESHTFSRPLRTNEKTYYNQNGYDKLVKVLPELIYESKEKPLNSKEEAIINIHDLADFLATKDLSKEDSELDLNVHIKEYNKLLKEYIKTINKFKRITNG